MKKRIIFESTTFDDYNYWASHDKKIYKKIVQIIKDILRTPFEGIGKPEPLKHSLAGYWSRRINGEHRIVYKATSDSIFIVSCRYHYK